MGRGTVVPEPLADQLYARICDARSRGHRVRQQELAEELDVSQSAISNALRNAAVRAAATGITVIPPHEQLTARCVARLRVLIDTIHASYAELTRLKHIILQLVQSAGDPKLSMAVFGEHPRTNAPNSNHRSSLLKIKVTPPVEAGISLPIDEVRAWYRNLHDGQLSELIFTLGEAEQATFEELQKDDYVRATPEEVTAYHARQDAPEQVPLAHGGSQT